MAICGGYFVSLLIVAVTCDELQWLTIRLKHVSMFLLIGRTERERNDDCVMQRADTI